MISVIASIINFFGYDCKSNSIKEQETVALLATWAEYFRLHQEATGTNAKSFKEVVSIVLKANPELNASLNEDLLTRMELDKWGRKIKFMYVTKGEHLCVVLFSSGPDGIFETTDDILLEKVISS